jgi:hypothetical protein
VLRRQRFSLNKVILIYWCTPNSEDRGGTAFKVLCYKSEGRRSLEFFIDIILPIALWPWFDSASNRNEYQEHFLGVKAAGA